MAIYNGTQKIKPSGVSKVYVGSQLVYQSGPNWRTVWTGSKSKTTSTTEDSNVNVWTGVTLTGIQTLRFTYSATVSGNGTTQYYTDSWNTTQPSSPVSITFNMSSRLTHVFGVRKYNNGPQIRTSLYYDGTDKKFYLYGYISSGGIKGASVTLTITKIEVLES